MSTKGIITIKKQDFESDLMLAEVGKHLRLIKSDLIIFGKGGKNQADQGEQTFLADTVEAIIAAIFIDSGYSYKKTKRCVRGLFKYELKKLEEEIIEPSSDKDIVSCIAHDVSCDAPTVNFSEPNEL
jgi:dsRNA-specific ribonuclease